MKGTGGFGGGGGGCVAGGGGGGFTGKCQSFLAASNRLIMECRLFDFMVENCNGYVHIICRRSSME